MEQTVRGRIFMNGYDVMGEVTFAVNVWEPTGDKLGEWAGRFSTRIEAMLALHRSAELRLATGGCGVITITDVPLRGDALFKGFGDPPAELRSTPLPAG